MSHGGAARSGMLRYDVFGRRIGVTRTAVGWVAVYLGPDGKRREARDVTIPAWVEEEGILRFLADVFHESASPDNPDVVFLGSDHDDPAVSLREEVDPDFARYSEISIAFDVDRILVPTPELGVLSFTEQVRTTPLRKDYDSEPDDHPSAWPKRFDTSSWTAISAWRGPARVGGLVLVHGCTEIDMLERRNDLAVIWDLRVQPAERGAGVGTLLVEAAADWARRRRCRQLKVETQNVNVPACRFYERIGFVLQGVDPDAYPGLPDEIQMLWYRTL